MKGSGVGVQSSGSDPDHLSNEPRSLKPLLFVALATFAILLPSLTYPLGPDDSAYAYVARRLLQGDVLYRDVWESKLGIYFLYASVFHFFGDTAVALRAFDLAWQIVTAWFVYLIAAEIYGRRAASLAACLYPLFYMDTNFWSMAQADSFLNLPSLIAVYSWMQCVRRRELSWAVWAGCGVGVATMLRPTAAALILLLPLVIGVTNEGRRESRRLLATTILSCLAAAATFVPLVFYFTASHAWHDFRATWFVMNPFYASQIAFASWGEAVVSIARQFQNTQWLDTRLELALILLGPMYALTQLRANRRVWIPFGYLLVTLLGLAIQRKFFVYQWSPLYPPLAMLAAGPVELRFERQLRTARQSLVRGLLALMIAFFVLSCLYVQARNWFEFVTYLTGRRSSQEYHRYFVGEGFSYPIEAEVAEYVRSCSKPNDTLCVWGFSPAIHYLSRRDAATGRLFFSHVILWPATPREWKDEYFHQLYSRPPKFFVIRRNDVMPQLTGRRDDSWAQAHSLPELNRFLMKHYRRDTDRGDPRTPEFYVIYRRNASR